MGFSIGGINTGLPPNLVEQIIEAEKAPIRNMEVRRGKSENRLALVEGLEEKIGGIQKSIAELAGTRGFADMQFLSGDPNVVQGIIDPGLAQPGSWNIEVIELAQKASAITNGFPDKDRTELGVGYFSFDTPDGEKEVYINGENNTLEGAANAINKANVGMRATVISDRKDEDYPFRLVISGDSVGDDNQIEYPTLYFLDGDQDLFFEETREAKNGLVKIDGFELEIPDNTLEDFIPGVTVELKQAAPGKNINLTVKEDSEAVSGKIKDFVETTNEVLAFIQNQNRLNEKTDTSQTLGGDSLLRTVESRIRRLIQGQMVGIRGNIKRLSQLGIQFNRNGTLDFDLEKFNTVLVRQTDHVQAFFAGDGFATGFIPSLKREVNNLLNQSFGPLSNRKRGLRQKIDRVNQQIERKEEQLAKREVTLRRKFSRLEQTMSRLKSQGGQVAAMGGGGGLGGLSLGGAQKSG